MDSAKEITQHFNNEPEEEIPRRASQTSNEKPVLSSDDGKIVRKAIKGKVDSADIKRGLNLENEPIINHVTCN